MKIILKEYKDGHWEVHICNEANTIVYNMWSFNTKPEAKAFISGITAAKQIINRLVQSTPTSYTTEAEA